MKKLFLLIVTMCMMLPVTIAQVSTWNGSRTAIINGTGTQSDPYLIENAAQLAQLAFEVNTGVAAVGGTVGTGKYYKLVIDINLNNLEWDPIGFYISTTNYYYFGGHFDGNNHTIANIKITENWQRAGLFGNIDGGSIKNLGVTSGSVKGTNVGGIVGYTTGSVIIKDCYNKATVSTAANYPYIGGIIGCVGGGAITIDNCYNTGSISSTMFYSYCGGIIGGNNTGISANVDNCYNIGNISGCNSSDICGGIIGNSLTNSNIIINNCYNTGNFSTTTNSGGIVGQGSSFLTINNCYNNGTLTASSYCGGIVGYRSATNQITINNCNNNGTLSSSNNCCGGILGYCSSGSVNIYNCNNNGPISTSSYRGGIIGSINSSNLIIDNCNNSGNFSGNTSYSGGIVGYTSSNVSINISNCYNSSSISGTGSYAGGIVGYATGTTTTLNINNCYNNAGTTICTAATSYSGGIVGRAENNLTNIIKCYNTSNASALHSGGIVGYSDYTLNIDYCYNNGSIATLGSSTSAVSAGGVLGYTASGSTTAIKNCYNTGSVTTGSSTASTYTGGIIGRTNATLTVNNCYNVGTVTTVSGFTCGIVGSGSLYSVNNCYYLDVSADNPGGGISKLAADMKIQYFVDSLNNGPVPNMAYSLDNALINNGYPVLAWQTDATLSNISVSSGILTPTFNSNVYSYTVNVANSIDTIIINATSSGTGAIISGDLGAQSLTVGNGNVFTINVTAVNGINQLQYTVTVNRAGPPSTDATLSNLTVSAGTLSPVFSSTTYNYTVNVANNINSLLITAITNHPNASVSGDGQQQLAVGTNPFTITVTAEDSITTQNYIIIVTRDPSNDASLSNLTVSAGTLTPIFNSTTYNYSVNVANNVTSISITATANHPQATISGNGLQNLVVGPNTFTITVTAEDNTTTEIYELIVTRLSNDATLSNLTVSAGTLTPTFNSTTYNYSVNVTNNIDTITITGTANHPNATVSGTGLKNLSVGINTFTIIGIAEDGTTTQNYIVTVNRDPSTDADLSNLTVSAGTLTPAFSSTTYNYSVNVANNINSISITATTNHPNATVIGDGLKQLAVGTNPFTIIVTAEDGITTQNYTIIITRDTSNDATLSNITVSAGTLTPTFSSTTYNYSVNVPYIVNNLTINVTANHPNATVIGDGLKQLAVGANQFPIIVTAEDGKTTQNYIVTVNRDTANIDATLATLTVSEGILTPTFSSTTYNYTVNVTNPINSISITATSNHPNATVVGDGSKALNIGNNPFTITVTAEDGTTQQNYNVTVHRDSATTPTPVTISGLVLDSTLTAVSGGLVRLYKVQTLSQYSLVASEPVQNDGSYLFTNVADGIYIVKAVAQTIANSLDTWYQSTEFWNYAIPIAVANNSLKNIDIQLIPITTVSGNSAISGYVSNGTGGQKSFSSAKSNNPAEDVVVYLQRYQNDSWETLSQRYTDENGYYEFTDISSGKYRVILDVPGVEMKETQEIEVGDGENLELANYIITDNGIYSSTTGIENYQLGIDNYELSVYPNPTNGIITIICVETHCNASLQNDATIQIYDISGRMVQTQLIASQRNANENEFTIDISHLESGMYYIKIANETVKIIKN